MSERMSQNGHDPHIYHYVGKVKEEPIEGFSSIGEVEALKEALKAKPGMGDISGLKVTKITGSLTLPQREYLVAQMAVPGFVRLLEVIYEGAATTYYRSGVKAGTALLLGEIGRWTENFVRPDRVKQPEFRFEADLALEEARRPDPVPPPLPPSKSSAGDVAPTPGNVDSLRRRHGIGTAGANI